MMFSHAVIASVLAATSNALPQAHWARGTPTSTASSTSTSPSAAASSSSAAGGGNVQIVNNLDTTVYLWSTSAQSGDMETVTSGDSYSEKWQTNSNGGGISIKMSTSESEDSVLQFEYTVGDDDTLYWDLSSINLDADSDFVTSGFSVTPSDGSCSSATCEAGDSDCADSYQQPDDVNTNSCSTSAQYTLTLG